MSDDPERHADPNDLSSVSDEARSQSAAATASSSVSADAAGATTGASVARGGVWEVTAMALPQVYVFVVSAFIARTLGPDIFGRVVLISGVQSAVTSFALWGFPYALIRWTGSLLGAGRASELRSLMSWSYRVVLVASGVGFAFMLGAALTGAHPTSAWVLAAITAAAATLHAVPSAFLVGAQQFGRARIMGIVTGSVSMLAKIVALTLGGGILALFAIDLVIVLANLAGTAALAARFQRPFGRDEVASGVRREILRFSGVIGITTAASLVVYQRTEIFLLAHYRSDRDIALYSVPFAMVTVLMLIPTAASSVLSPAVATLWGAGEVRRIRSGFARGLRIMVLLTLILAGLAAAVGPAFIQLVYGPQFDNVTPVLLLLLVAVPIVPLGAMSTSILRGIGLLRWLTVSGVLAAVLNIVLAFALVPPFGPLGAAGANSLAQVGAALPLVFYAVRRLGGVPLPASELLRGGIVAVAAAAVAYFVARPLPAAAGVGAGVLSFSGAALAMGAALRVVSPDDRVWLGATFTQALRLRLRR
jgi:O-antigen/teichoic acid export membrane protein